MVCTLLHVSNPGIIQCIIHFSRNWPMPTYVHLCMYPTRILHQSTACIGICSVIHVYATAVAWYYILGARASIDIIQALLQFGTVESWFWWSLHPEDFQNDVPQSVLFACIATINLQICSTSQIQPPVEGARCCESISFWYTKGPITCLKGKMEGCRPWVCEGCAINGLATTVCRSGDISCIRSWPEGAELTRNVGIASSIKNGNCIADGIIADSHYWARINCRWSEEVHLDAKHKVATGSWAQIWRHLPRLGYDKSEEAVVHLACCEMYFSVIDIGQIWHGP